MLSDAIKIAERSSIKRHKTGAVIRDRNGKIISTGWSHRTHVRLSETPWSMHAELHAILRAPRDELVGATIEIATLNARGDKLVYSKPCVACAGIIDEVGITEVVFTMGANK